MTLLVRRSDQFMKPCMAPNCIIAITRLGLREIIADLEVNGKDALKNFERVDEKVISASSIYIE